jgi:hypothetical protein
MTAFIKNHSPIFWVLILVTMLVLTWLFPSFRLIIEVTFLLVSLALASLVVVAKNWEPYQQGKLTRGALVGHSIFDIFSIVLAMASAGLAANFIAQLMMSQAGGRQSVVQIAAVIVVSLLAGISIGLLMKRIRRQVLRPSHP